MLWNVILKHKNRLIEQLLTTKSDTLVKEHTVRLKTCENDRLKNSLEQASRKLEQIDKYHEINNLIRNT